MKYYVSIAVLSISIFTNCLQWKNNSDKLEEQQIKEVIMESENQMRLGAFSVSLSVKDLAASKAFYEKLGFEVLAGSFDINYFIMKNEDKLIGLFYGMFEGNILTFNPGWDSSGELMDEYDDIRDIHKHLVSQKITINEGSDIKEKGPSSFTITDPDGNLILMDQHR